MWLHQWNKANNSIQSMEELINEDLELILNAFHNMKGANTKDFLVSNHYYHSYIFIVDCVKGLNIERNTTVKPTPPKHTAQVKSKRLFSNRTDALNFRWLTLHAPRAILYEQITYPICILLLKWTKQNRTTANPPPTADVRSKLVSYTPYGFTSAVSDIKGSQIEVDAGSSFDSGCIWLEPTLIGMHVITGSGEETILGLGVTGREGRQYRTIRLWRFIYLRL